MINLRYHIVSITAIFLAIGIGLTLGSTFLDRATVDNLQGQLERLETRLADREAEVNELQGQAATSEARQEALDEQGTELLSGRLDGEPVVVLATRGVDETEVRDAVEALVVAGADVHGLWWITDRFLLGDDASVAALAEVIDETSSDPSRLRRGIVEALGRELRARQSAASEAGADAPAETPADPAAPVDGDAAAEDPATEDPAAGDEPVEGDAPVEGDGPGDTDAGSEVGDPEPGDSPIPITTALVEAGFIEFEPLAGGPETPTFPAGTSLLMVGGSAEVADDLVLEPLIARMTAISEQPVLAVVSSAMPGTGGVSDAVTVIREDAAQRELVSTVDDLEHFSGRAAVVLALDDLADGVVGHYGLSEGATRLLPPPRAS